MLFQRRNPPHWLERVRIALWPRHSFSRSARYFAKRVLRLTASPHAVALGFAAGAFASFTPFVGFHFLLAFFVAFVIGGNMLASALGTAVGNPLTFPFIWASTYRLGHVLLGHDPATRGHHPLKLDLLHQSLDAIWPIFKPMLVGAIPLGFIAGTIAYFIVYGMVRTYQATRREKLSARREATRAEPREVHPGTMDPSSLEKTS
ncbi:hypothetical protein C8N35_10229 [Breoghania corrubedonensis]|uniref:DUF2062 domain-containing protein n=1 Tax=Breoghania corrubedonensis TaxID=665038 RepID=A0A2T5VC40_9HYPH|nr:DUF2062 domain-containing protein [Breoghania corrubedonensis]PTW61320.1 hypothetical protein C8N35_10229 [Breoghania corrubedonensis]